MQRFLYSLLLGIIVSMPEPAMSAEHTIDFTRGHNLKQFYDAGLRPWRTRPEANVLTVTNEVVRVIAPNGGNFTMDVEICSLSVGVENELFSVDFIAQPLDLPSAKRLAEHASAALNIDTNQGAGMAGLGVKVDEFRRLGFQTPYPQYWSGRGGRDGVRYGVTLNPLFGMDVGKARGKVYVNITFPYEKPMRFPTEPIKPPPGYEHMSMDPPESKSTEPFPDPAYSMENMQKRIQEHGHIGFPSSSADANTQARSPGETSSPTGDPAPQTSLLPWLLGGLAVMIGLALLL